MKKAMWLMAGLLFLVAAVSFAGGAGEKSAAAGGKVSLSMYYYNDRTSPVEAPNWDYELKTFESANPDIDLQVQYGFSDAYHNKLQAMVAANQIPDIVFLWPDKRTSYATGGTPAKFMDLTPYVKGHEKEFAPGALNPQLGGKAIWELPEQVTDTHVMYANQKLLKQLGLTFPKTLDDLLAQAPTILNAGLIPIAMDDKDGWQVQSCLLGSLIGRTGGNGWFDKALSGKGASFTDPQFVNALTVIQKLAQAKMFSPGIVQASYGVAEGDFANEKAVYMIDGGWRVNALNGDLKPTQYGDITLNTFPDLPASMVAGGVAGSTAQVAGTGFGMRADLTGDKAAAAWKWIWYYSGPVGSAIRQGFGADPAYLLPPNTNLKPLITALDKFVATTPTTYVVDSVMSPDAMAQLQPAMQEIILGNKTPQQVAGDFEKWVAANESTRK